MENKKEEQFWKILDSLRFTGIRYYNMFSSLIQLIFIKYIITYPDLTNLNYKDIGSVYKAISEFRRQYDAARNGIYLERYALYDLLRTIDENVDSLGVKLTSIVDNIDFFFEKDNQTAIIRTFDEFEIPSNKEDMIDMCENILYNASNDVRRTGELTTNRSLRQLLSRLLSNEKETIFMNCYAGYSTILLNAKECKKYVAYDIYPEAVLVSTLLSIMLNIKEFIIKNEDYLKIDTNGKADILFSDAPLNMKKDDDYAHITDLEINDPNALSIYKSYLSLNKNGVGAILVPGRALFSTTKSYSTLRKTLAEKGLKAVIALPPMFSGTVVNTNLIVVQNDYVGDVEFVDASNLGVSDKRTTILKDEEMEKILSAYKKLENINSFAKKVDRRDVVINENWLPSTYIKYEETFNYRSVEQIDNELKSLYAELLKIGE